MTKKRAARRSPARPRPRRRARSAGSADVGPQAVTAAELTALRRELERRLAPGAPSGGRRRRRPLQWNPDPQDVQRSVAQLVLTLVEFLRRLMERQAIQRMDRGTLTEGEIEAVGRALMSLETTIREIGRRFGLTPEDLNLDLGPLGTLM